MHAGNLLHVQLRDYAQFKVKTLLINNRLKAAMMFPNRVSYLKNSCIFYYKTNTVLLRMHHHQFVFFFDQREKLGVNARISNYI